MKILDLFCGAGGASAGYKLAFPEADITGIDIVRQPHYPFRFHVGHALAFNPDWYKIFDFIHASPPCQRFSTMTKRWGQAKADAHPDLISETRELLERTGKPWVIENVVGAPLRPTVMLCGSMFGLPLRRHRIFEASFSIPQLRCLHTSGVVGVYGHAGGSSKRDGLHFNSTDVWRSAMQIDWMVGKELVEAIPPAYTRYIGENLRTILSEERS